jgi:hypothetical protein
MAPGLQFGSVSVLRLNLMDFVPLELGGEGMYSVSVLIHQFFRDSMQEYDPVECFVTPL